MVYEKLSKMFQKGRNIKANAGIDVHVIGKDNLSREIRVESVILATFTKSLPFTATSTKFGHYDLYRPLISFVGFFSNWHRKFEWEGYFEK